MRFQLIVATVLSLLGILALGVLAFFAFRYLSEMLAKADGNLACRNCKSKSIHPSLSGAFADSLFGIFGCVPYRCEVCQFRFYVRRPHNSINTAY